MHEMSWQLDHLQALLCKFEDVSLQRQATRLVLRTLDLEVLEELLVARWVDEYVIVAGRSVEGWMDT